MSEATVPVLVFSDDSTTRKAVVDGVGIKASKDTPRIEWVEAATTFGVVEAVKEQDFALIILDAETQGHGGMGVAKELQNVIEEDLPPLLFLTARPQDEWLATWAGASAVVTAPLSPIVLQETVASLLGGR